MIGRLVLTGMLVYLTNPSLTQTGSDVADLIQAVYTDAKYDKRIRPSRNQRQQTNVTVDLVLLSIDYLDEVTETLKTTSYLTIVWIDEYLQWNPSSYGGIDTAYLPQDDIWRPDIALTNSYKEYKELGVASMRVVVTNQGEVQWDPFLVSISTCSVDTTYFPFDIQTCHLIFDAWSYPKNEVFLKGHATTLLASYKESSAWTLVDISWTIDVASVASKITYSLKLRRKPLHVLLNILLPITLLSVLNILVFVLPCESGERAGYAITVFLSFAVFLTIVSSTLPENSDTVAIFSVFIVIQTIQSTLIMMIALVLIRMNFFDEKTPIPKHLLYLARLGMLDFCLKRNSGSVQPLTTETDRRVSVHSMEKMDQSDGQSGGCTNGNPAKDKYTWRYVIKGLDTFCFVMFLFILILTTVVCTVLTVTSN